MQQNSAIATFLLDHGIKPSAQRIAVAGYLAKHLTHPTVDEIYCDLLHDYPTLSRTTVYNTVNLLAQNGCISTLDVDSLGTRYDFNSSLHAHFVCDECGAIHDIPLSSIPSLPEGFIASTVSLHYRGVCPECNAKKLN